MSRDAEKPQTTFADLGFIPTEALTLEQWRELTKNATRNLTDDPIRRRRGQGAVVTTTTTEMKDFT